MANGVTRRPLPAVISLAALLLLTAIVWWRVLHRSDNADAAGHCASPTPSASQSKSAPSHSQLPAASAISVQVLNSTNRTGLAGSVRRKLMEAGFASPAKAADDSAKLKAKNTGVAQIRYGAKGKAGAAYLHYYFPGATLQPNSSTSATVVVALGAKFKTIPSKDDVDAELKRSSVAVASPSPSPTPSPSASC